ncbi:beta-N-acetylhexosaminidase [Flavihumibacter solisilvae]|uniref:beta-N-acetylhexosaminidase n=1 Tax=Flavihumibacter solisilvae TaxID=1349421 RepID=UPI001364BC41|nr:beta-N-acetylhexosaminidase [Flavihumibacter solisilvae]
MQNQKIKRSFLFLFTVLTGQTIFAQESTIIPYPAETVAGVGHFTLTANTRITHPARLNNEAKYLQQLLKEEHQLSLQVAKPQSSKSNAGNIQLELNTAAGATQNSEAYALSVTNSNIKVTGNSAAGVFYGIQSLRQLIKNGQIPCVTINDAPAFKWRAFMLDEGRYFKGENEVKQIFDQMALLKMNVFHWHLTDDGGWRVEIKKYPELTRIGSKRRMSETGTWLSNVFDSIPHEGFYTQEQIKGLVKYAADRHITIIPEIEMPGHASAAIASYPWLGTENKPIEVPISFGIKKDIFNVANPKVKAFLHDVLDEVMKLFPSNIVHIGGDEVIYDQWKASGEVAQYMKENHIKTPADLQIDFTNGISRYLEQKGHRMIGWNDILGGLHGNNDSTDASTKDKLSQNTIIQFWTGNPEIVTQAVMKGHDVVNAYWDNTYLDYDYKHTPLSKAYRFNPIPASLPADQRHKILGIGTQMWGEWIPTVERMNYLIYPRVAAMAEVAWTKQEQKNFERFTKSLDSYLVPSWKKMGISIKPEQLNDPVQ